MKTLKKSFLIVEGEKEIEWLQDVGLAELIEPWKQGREVHPEELNAALCTLSLSQAETVKQRVKTLNYTIKQRYNHRQKVRKPDIREFFKDAEMVINCLTLII